MRFAIAISLVWLGAGTAHAQTDLGTVRVTRPARVASGDFVIVDRLPVPRIDAGDVPAAAAEALLRYYASTELLIGAAAELRGSPTPARADALRAALPTYEADRAASRARLLAALEHAFDTLGRAARLVLGELRYEVAAEAALDALDQCEANGGTSCDDSLTGDYAPARRAWSQVTGGDSLAAQALYQRAYLASQTGDPDARTLLEQAVAMASLPAELEPRIRLMLGELVVPDDPDAARASFDRCAALTSSLAVHCAIRSAELDLARSEVARAVTTLAPFVGTSDSADGLAAEAMLSLEQTALPGTIAASTRASLLALGGERLASLGLFARAREWLTAAATLDPALVPRRDAIAAPPTDTPETWLARVTTYCLHRVDASAVVSIEVRARVEPRSHAIRVARASPVASPDLGACLAHAPAPETPLRGSFRASIAIDP